MRYYIAVSLFVCAAVTVADVHAGWKTVQPKNAGFTIQMPGTPQAFSKVVKDDGVSYRATKIISTQGGVEYQVAYAAIPVNIPSNQVDQLLQNVIGGIAQSSRMSIYFNQKVDVQGKPARIFVLQGADNVYINGMTCWDGHHNYIVSLKGTDVVQSNLMHDYGITFKLLVN